MCCPNRLHRKSPSRLPLPPAASQYLERQRSHCSRARPRLFSVCVLLLLFAVRAAIGRDQRRGHRSRRRRHPQRASDAHQHSQGTALNATTNSAGEYSVPALEAGTYNLQVTAPGFKKYEATGIVLRVSRTERVDAKLSVGAVTSEVKVSRQ